MKSRKMIAIMLVIVFLASTLTYITLEYSNMPVNTAVAPQLEVSSLRSQGYSFNKSINLSYQGDSETINLFFAPLNRTVWGQPGPTMITIIKTSQDVSFYLSGITFKVVSLAYTMLNVTNVLHPTDVFTFQNDTQLRYGYLMDFPNPGNFTVNYSIVIEPVFELGPLHQSGDKVIVDYTQNLEVYETPP